jgi:hypothetical protein
MASTSYKIITVRVAVAISNHLSLIQEISHNSCINTTIITIIIIIDLTHPNLTSIIATTSTNHHLNYNFYQNTNLTHLKIIIIIILITNQNQTADQRY